MRVRVNSRTIGYVARTWAPALFLGLASLVAFLGFSVPYGSTALWGYAWGQALGNTANDFTDASPVSPHGRETVRVPILVYHAIRPYRDADTPFMKKFVVEPDIFAAQMQYVKDQGYTAVDFQALLDAWNGTGSLPPKPVIITFDDGWESQYVHAFPVLKAQGLRATFFVFTNGMGHPYFLTWDQLKEMQDAGMTIAAHTKSHPYLFDIHDEAALKDEIAGSKRMLEARLGRPVNAFAYPFGEHDKRLERIVEESGFQLARASVPGFDHPKDTRFALSSTQIINNLSYFKRVLDTAAEN